MTARMLFVLILATLLPAAAAAQAAQPSTQYSVTALTLSRAVFGGIRAGLEASFREGKVTADTLACVASLDESGLAPVYQSLMREVLSEEDIRKLDAFYGSEAGRRYFRWSLNQLRIQQQLPVTEPMELSQQELDQANAFHASGPGLVLAGIGAEGSASQKTVNDAVVKALEPCKR